MIVDSIIAFCVENRFGVGLIIGAAGFGIPMFVIGWGHGHDGAMRKIGEWLRPKNRDPETYGDVPTLPPVRDRRPIATTPGRHV